MEFRSAYNFRNSELPFGSYEESYVTPSGEKIVYEHREEMTKEGKRTLIKDRAVNIYEKIQASKEACDIENILRRAAEGDMSVLSVVNGQYIDITDAPRTLAEAQQFVIRTKNEFDQLPKDIRAKFENNAEIYVATYGTQSWIEKTGLADKYKAIEAEKQKENTFKKNIQETFANLAEKGALKNE